MGECCGGAGWGAIRSSVLGVLGVERRLVDSQAGALVDNRRWATGIQERVLEGRHRLGRNEHKVETG